MITVTHKPVLDTPKPYFSLSAYDYLEYLSHYRNDLYSGNKGVYLSSQVTVDDQILYYPFIDIDGDNNVSGDARIESAILNAIITYKTLKLLNVSDRFTFIFTGKTGFRAVSNILVDKYAYLAFIDLIKGEMPHIIDTAPTENYEMPQQIIAYKGSKLHNHGELVDRHSAVVPKDLLYSEAITANTYKELTRGRPDPEEIIQFMEGFFNFTPVADLNSLGKFGVKLTEYTHIRHTISAHTFDYRRLQEKTTPLSIEVLKEKLTEKGILCKIEKRHSTGRLAISFQGLPCPDCGKTTANARAFPPYYTLKCFNMHCRAYNSLPLVEWSGIAPVSAPAKNFIQNQFSLSAPERFVAIEEAREIIGREILSNEDILFVETAGTGKSHAAIEAIAPLKDEKLIIYSSFNKKLQGEAYEKTLSFANGNHVYLLQPREDTCTKVLELEALTKMGYSPAELLCSKCTQSDVCMYYSQRKDISKGIVFVTHHMLRYLEKVLPKPDLIILDEDIVKGFFLVDEFEETDLRSLAAVIKEDKDFALIENLLEICNTAAKQLIRQDKHNPILINARLLRDKGEETVISILSKQYGITEPEMLEKVRHITGILNIVPRTDLYKKGVSYKAVDWIKSILSDNRFPYLIVKENGKITFAVKYITPLGYSETPVKILDATGDKRVVESLIGRPVRVVASDVKWDGRRIHIKTSTGRGIMRKSPQQDLKLLLTTALNEISSQKVMVVTYMDMEDKILNICKELHPAKEFMGYHFMGPRGINDYKDCNAVLVLGLPYPNLNSAWQDAHILFPGNDELQDVWPDASMMWELVQNIHRIRPVLKDTTEVLIIARFWPSILPEPTQIIDKSADRNWKEIAIKRLEPYVREFCFFNRDIASLARICLNSKRNSAFYFLKEIVGYIRFLFVDHPGNTEGMNHLENVVHTMCESERFMGSNGDYQTAKLFSDIVTVYIKKQLPEDSVSTVIFVILQIWKTEFSTRLLNDSPTIALTRAQWSELETHFREKNPIFESFKIRLPYARNNYVYGVGVKRQVVSFYNELSEIPGFPEVKTDTYEMRESSRKAIEPLPTGYIVVYMPNDESELSYMGHEENISIIPLRKAVNAVGSCIKPNSKRTTIITNDGKRLAKMLIQAGHPHYDIEDVWLNERLIRNGEGMPDRRKPRFLFNNYGLSFDVDSATMVSQLYTVWKSQHEMIEKLQLRNIARLEKEVLWIISGMEVYGIGFDDEAFKWHYGEMIMDKGLREDRLYTDTHASINLEDSQSVEKYISNTSMNEEWKEELRGLYGEYRDIVTETESFAQFYQNVSSGRFHNEINQLGSATGRLSTKLDHTPKKGPLRSYIKAPEGYTFIIADYKNQETRIIYGLSHDTKGIETLERGKDIFIETAALVTGKPESECSHLRDIFKLFVNSVHNGARAYGIQQMLANAHKDVTVEQANEFIEGYFRQHPDVKSWMKKTKEKAREDGYVQTVIGRRQIVFTEQDGTKDSSIYNFPIQGNGADGLKLAMVLLNKKLQGKNARIVLTLHDEIIVESNIDIAGEVRQVVKEVMVEAFTKLVPNVPFDVKMDIRNTWGKLNDPVDPENNV